MSLIGLLSLPILSLSQSNFSGYYRFESGILTHDDGDFLFNRNILQPEYRHQSNDYSLNIALQLRHDLNSSVDSPPVFRLREAYIDIRRETFDLRLGQQMIVWGRADAAQIHDIITPMDLSEFLTQDFTDLRVGVTAINFTYYLQSNSIQFLVIPIYQPSMLAEPESRWNLYPTDNVTYSESKYPSSSLKNTQLALRWNNRSNLNLDLDISLYSGYNPTPALAKNIASFVPTPTLDITSEYYRNTGFLLGAEYRINKNLTLTTEQAFWLSSRFDLFPESLRNSTNSSSINFNDLSNAQNTRFLSESPYLQSLWGMRFPFLKGTLSFQYTLEYIMDYNSSLLQEEYHHSGSILYTKSSTDDRWMIRFLSRYHLGENDAWINPDVTYAGIDGIRFNAGGHLFVGDRPDPFYGHSTFYHFRNNSFVYLKLTAYW